VAYFADQKRAATCDKLTLPIVTVLTSGDIVGVGFRMEVRRSAQRGQKYTSIWYDQWRIVDGAATSTGTRRRSVPW
jgi:predicted SnoaL-like aldol condensation-catalyzing enzyme